MRTSRALLAAPILLLAACAAPTDDTASDPESSESAVVTKTLVTLTAGQNRPVFNVRCSEDGQFRFKVRGFVQSGTVYPEGAIDESPSQDEFAFETGSVQTFVPPGAFLEIEPPGWWHVVPGADTSTALDNTRLSLKRGPAGLVATGEYRNRPGTFTCTMWARGFESGMPWKRVL